GDAKKLADALSASALDATVQLEARTIGNRLLRAGGLVEAKQVPTAFAGTYRLSAVRHLYAEGGFWTEFSCHGARDGTLASALAGPASAVSAMTPAPGITSVAVGVVTNNKDPDNLGRVKVKLPWLPSEQPIESDWMRLVAMGAGAGRGWFWLPEVNDEVLVAFEHGDIRRPFILGGLWNGRDKPPITNGDAVAGDGTVNRRFMKTRTGHTLEFNDSPDAPKVELVTKSGKLKMTFDDKKADFKLASGNDVSVDNNGNLTITTKGNVEVKATGNLKLTGNQVTIEAKSNLEIKAGGSAKVAANASLELTGTAQAKLSGTGGAEVSSPAVTQVKGSLVKIN
ncbi:MAG TPA: phage baseplate assembly protein V, partial [Acidimicrobiales bacterium]|nr:phage baseplate assembly protein V [Acidimicrobiales bacterium]